MTHSQPLIDLARRVGAFSSQLKGGSVVYRPGSTARGWIVIAEGGVRVGLTADNGREILLYRLGPGDACILSTSALLSQKPLPAEAVTETDVVALVVPSNSFESLIAADDGFRREVLRAYAERVGNLVLTLEDVLFHALPQRLARLLLNSARDGAVAATHQEIAAELGTAREVVTRALKTFERDGLVAAERGQVRLIDATRLTELTR